MSENEGIWENCGLDGVDECACEDGRGGRSICNRGGPGVDLARGRVGVDGEVTVSEGTAVRKERKRAEQSRACTSTYDRPGMAHPMLAGVVVRHPGTRHG